jgi:hypothetical protein
LNVVGKLFGYFWEIVWILLGHFWDFLDIAVIFLDILWIFLILFGYCWDIIWVFTSVKLSSFCCMADNRMGCTFSSVVLDSVFDYCNAFTAMGRAMRGRERE